MHYTEKKKSAWRQNNEFDTGNKGTGIAGKSDCKGRGLAVIWGTIGVIMPCGRRDPLPVLWKSI